MKKRQKNLIDDDGEARELTAADVRRLRRARDVDPALVAAYEAGTLRYRGQRGKQKAPTKSLISIRVDPDVLAFFREQGAGWQTRMGEALRSFVEDAR